jgi:hypothetical protein
MANAKGKTAEPENTFDENEFEDLFEGFGDDGDADLLDQVEEDDSEGWVPENPGDGIQGVIVRIGETRSDFEDDPGKAMVPTWTLQTKDGGKWRVIGYGAVLKREMQDSGAEIGDLAAIKFFGEKPIKKGKFAGKLYKHYGVAVRKPRARASA